MSGISSVYGPMLLVKMLDEQVNSFFRVCFKTEKKDKDFCSISSRKSSVDSICMLLSPVSTNSSENIQVEQI